MAINLASKYSSKIAEKFTKESFVAGNTSQDYDWQGVKTISIYTPITVGLNNYTRSGQNRFGNPVEMQDEIQTMPLRQDKGFSITIDRGNNEDQQMIKNAGKMLNLQIAEQVVPYMDKYALNEFICNAGNTDALANAPTKSTIVEKIFDGAKALDNGMVPMDNRVLYIPTTYYNMLRLSSEFLAVDKLADKALSKGVVGMIADMKVVKVPDTYFPQASGSLNAYFLITYKRSVLFPNKIKTARILKDVQGIDGAVLEGRNYFDAYVIGAKAAGVYAALPNATKVATPTVTISSHAATLACTTNGATIKYTLDGTDPRFSPTAETYSSAVTTTAGTVVKCYASKSGMYNSAVATGVDA